MSASWLFASQCPAATGWPLPRVKIGNGWTGFTSFGATDWDRDGHQDIITRQDSTGDLWLYPGDSRRGPAQTSRVKIGNGWTGFTSFGA
jgi:hypothetical protein